jgi:hypothetical protein
MIVVADVAPLHYLILISLIARLGDMGGHARDLDAPRVWYRIGAHGFRTRHTTLVTTWHNAEPYRVSDRAERSRRCWPVETDPAQLRTSMQMNGLHSQTALAW